MYNPAGINPALFTVTVPISPPSSKLELGELIGFYYLGTVSVKSYEDLSLLNSINKTGIYLIVPQNATAWSILLVFIGQKEAGSSAQMIIRIDATIMFRTYSSGGWGQFSEIKGTTV